ncbi:MAG: ROK family protein [Candidatus Dormibacteria bacterium]
MARTERGATHEAVRRHNLATVLGHLHRRGPTSRAQLTQLLGLNRATIGDLVDDLVARGLVLEAAEPQRGARGRPSKVVGVSQGGYGVLAVQVGVDAVDAALVGLGGPILARRRAGLTRPGQRAVEQVVRTVARLGQALLERGPASLTLAGVGVAVPGAVNFERGVVNFAPNLGWRQVPLADLVRARLGLEVAVLVGNDASLGAMAEHSRGVGSRVNDLIYLHAEVGVGGGLISGGRMLDGARGYGGEVGHMQVNPNGIACHCGSTGCWETECGEEALLRRAGVAQGGRLAVEQVLRRAAAHDPRSLGAVVDTSRWISVGLVNLVNTLNPEMVILGGMFEGVLSLTEGQLRLALARGAYDSDHPIELRRPQFGADAVLVGAAELALGPLLQQPALAPVRLPAALTAPGELPVGRAALARTSRIAPPRLVPAALGAPLGEGAGVGAPVPAQGQ